MRIAVDSSALVAILRAESDALDIARCLGTARQRLMSAPVFMECGIVVAAGYGASGLTRLRILLSDAEIELTAFDAEEAEVGLRAFRRYGKGSGHRAQLNFGDCLSYAMAKTRNLPLLFTGNDFVHTDVEAALDAS